MITDQYYLHGILLPGATWIGQLTDTTPAANIEFLTDYASGSAIVPSFRGAHGARPDISFTSPQIKTILDATGLTGVAYAANNVDLFYRKGTVLGTRDAIGGGTHLLVRARRSFFYWTQIEASQDAAASISCRIVPTFDGTNAPIVGLGSQNIAANLLAAQEYTLGPVKPNGTPIDGVQSWTLSLNPDVNAKASDGESFWSFFGVRRHDPVLSVYTPDLDRWVSIGTGGLQITTLTAYLRKKKIDSTSNEADGSAVHIKFTGADNPCGLATLMDTSGGVTDEAALGLNIGLRISAADTAYPLTLSTASAIT